MIKKAVFFAITALLVVFVFTVCKNTVESTGTGNGGKDDGGDGPKTVSELIKTGNDAIVKGNYDAALNAYESAWEKDNSNADAIIYSSLAKLVSIAKSQEVQDLMRNHLGFTGYPGTIDALISPDWLDTYTNERLEEWYEEGNNWFEWHNADDSSFFSYNGITPRSGYYGLQYYSSERLTFISNVRQTGHLNYYYDQGVSQYVYWYDYNPNLGYGGTAGYYYWGWNGNAYTYTFVKSASETGNLKVIVGI